ncbi:MAG TPA: Mor transcription activator family protein [Candidatus Binataceae bacterium]
MSASPQPLSALGHPPASPARAHLGRISLLEEISRLVGPDLFAKLCDDFGGRRVYIPTTPARGDLLARSIGVAASNKLARIYGGDRLDIPVDCEHSRRRMLIFQLREHGASVSAIARKLHCTERYVYKVLAASRRSGTVTSED